MGYRLEIYKKEHFSCGGKLFGYIDDETLEKCKSYQWLKNKYPYIFNGDEYWGYGFNPQLSMWGDEFKEFIKLYIEDKKKYSGFRQLCTDFEEYKDIDDHDEIVVEWY